MTELEIEAAVSAMYDVLDMRFMKSRKMTEEQYEAEAKAIDAWAERKYAERFPGWQTVTA